jgi:ATP-dependent DNA helicase RecG
MHANGSPPPIFETDLNRSFFLVRLTAHPRFLGKLVNLPFVQVESSPTSNSGQRKLGSESGSESVRDRILNALRKNALSRSEIAAIIGHKSITGAVRRALNQLMDSGVVEYTIPEKPQSRLQKYRISSQVVD